MSQLLRKLLSLPATCDKTTLKRSTAYVLMRDDPTFPKPVKIGARRIAFVESEVDAWIDSRIAARDSKAGAA